MGNPYQSVKEAVQDFLRLRGQSYRKTFEGIHGERVLADLAQFCRANETTFHENERAHVLAEGRREVWLRISKHLHLTDEELYDLLKPEE